MTTLSRRLMLGHLRRVLTSVGALWLLPGTGHNDQTGTGRGVAAKPRERPIWFDDDGLIVHAKIGGKWDGGDTAQREGWYWVGRWIREKWLKDPWQVPRELSFTDVLALLEPKSDGVFYRHPKLPPWNNPFDKEFGFSRDQMVPLVAAMGLWGHESRVRRLWNALPQDPVGGTKHSFNGAWVKDPVFGQNLFHTGDIIGPATINLFRRAWNEDPMPAGDGNGPGGECELAGNVGIRVGLSKTSRDDTGDDLNLIIMLLMALIRHPSRCDFVCPQIKIPGCTAQTVQFYAKNREPSYGSFLGAYRAQWGDEGPVADKTFIDRLDQGIAAGWSTDASRVYGAIRWYHRAKVGANPQLAEMYEPIVRAFLQ